MVNHTNKYKYERSFSIMVTSKHLLLFSFLALILHPAPVSAASASIPAFFAFGDSTLDSGNNNRIPTIFQANHAPYGQDFPGHVPTGRFTNGKLTTDFVVSQLGLKDVLPAYAYASDKELLTGVSFASGGSGLDDLTVTEASVISMTTQLNNFENAVHRMQSAVGQQEAGRIVENAIYMVGAGTNDMTFNFYGLPLRTGLGLYGYQDMLLGNLEAYLRRLYSMGARKIAVTGLPPIGCLPLQVTIGSIMPSPHMLQRVCVDRQNEDSQIYNDKLQARLNNLQAELAGSRFVYADIYNPLLNMIQKPSDYGFTTTSDGCCGVGLGAIEMGPLCNSLMPMCPDPSKFVFFDAVHPTQTAYYHLAGRFMTDVLPSFTA